MALSSSERSRRYYQKRKENGLCISCGKPLDRQGTYCISCLDKRREDAKKERAFLKKYHICTYCRKEKVFGNDTICPECRAKKNEYASNLDHTTEEYKEYQRVQHKKMYKKRIEAGLCVSCGKRKPEDGKVRCRICLNKNNESKRKSYERNGYKREYREDHNLCFFCGNPLDTNHKKVCKKCYDKFVESGKKSSGAGKSKYWIAQNKLISKK